MIKFKTKTKGFITQGIAQNATTYYAEQGLIGHTGVDSTLGYGSPVRTDNAGYVYKIYRAGDTKSNWAGVYMIVPHEDYYIEVCVGHMSEIYVDIGDIPEGLLIGKEGNKGKVFSGGVEITPTMQKLGDKRGSHRHESYRPVRKVSKKTKGEHYLSNPDGSKYFDGSYYQVIYKDNGLNGCVDPLTFHYEDTTFDKIRNYLGIAVWLNKKK